MSDFPEPMTLRLAVLASAGGTTLQNLIDRIADGRLPNTEIVCVVSNNRDAFALDRARRSGLPTAIVNRKVCKSRQEFSERIFDNCRQKNADIVCMAGFLQLVTIPEDFALRVINIHPSLIPAFCGKGFFGHHVHEAVLEYGAKVTGCTVHFADNEYDRGPIILQKTVTVLDDDTPDSLAARVFEQECEALPEAIRLIGDKRLVMKKRRVCISS